EVKVGDPGELAKGARRGERGLPHDRAQARVRVLPPAPAREKADHDVVESRLSRNLVARYAEAGGEARSEPGVKVLRARVGGHREQLGTDYGDDQPLIDVVEKVVPRVRLEWLNAGAK